MKPVVANIDRPLLDEIRSLIGQARRQFEQAANSTLTMLYRHFRHCVRQELLPADNYPMFPTRIRMPKELQNESETVA